MRISDEFIEPADADSNEIQPNEFVPHDVAPIPTKKVDAIYPEDALDSELHGAVYIQAWVTKRGVVRRARVLRSANRILNRAALKAVVQWQFQPATLNAQPIDVWVVIPFRF